MGFDLSGYKIRTAVAADVLDLRAALLLRGRDNHPPVAGDEDPTAFHVAVYREDEQVGVGSIHPEAMPEGPTTNAWRLHSVAVAHGHRGFGVGALIVERCLEHSASHDARAVWCLAPAGAFGFFDRFGFQRTGDPIENDDGPQYKLFAKARPVKRSWAI